MTAGAAAPAATAATAGTAAPAATAATAGTATLTRSPAPAPATVSTGGATTAPSPGRTRRARMRDVVERGEGVRISGWRRLRAFVSLVVLVTMLGLSAAAVVGGFALLIAYALDQAIS
jgi:hypothetical protein